MLKASLFAIVASLFFAVPVYAAQPGTPDIQYSEHGLASVPPISGTLEKLPKELLTDYHCGQYFAGRVGDDPDAPVTFLLHKSGSQGDLLLIFIMTKKNIAVVWDNKQKIPLATVKMIDGRKKVELRLSTAEMRKATCLPKPSTWKGA